LCYKESTRLLLLLFVFVTLVIVFSLAVTFRPLDVQEINPNAAEKVGPDVSQTLSDEGAAQVVIALRQNQAMMPTQGDLAALTAEVAAVQQAVLAPLSPTEYRSRHIYQAVPALAGTILSPSGLAKLAADPLVIKIDLDVGGTGSLGTTVPLIDADKTHASGITGAGVVVAVLDTGIDTDHDDLKGAIIWQECFVDTNFTIGDIGGCPNGNDRQSGTGAAEDDAGHGTHVNGIVGSDGVVSSVGVAPDAEIVAIKVLDNCSFAGCFYAFSEIVAALDFIITDRPDVDVINMSIGTNARFSGDCDNSTSWNIAAAAAISTLRANGVITFASSGNNASGTEMTSPACLSNVVSVGATDANDAVASFTNSNAQTDIMAPGVSVVSDAIGNGTTTASGTSMASPHAAGCAALLISSGLYTTPDAIENRLKDSSILVTDATNGLSFPRIECGPPLFHYMPSIMR